MKVVWNKLETETERWFIPIVKDDGSIETIIHEEAVWRFLDKETTKGTPYTEIMKKKVSDVLDFLKEPANEDLRKKVKISLVLLSARS